MLTPLGFSQEIVTSGSALALEIAPTQAMVSIAAVDKGIRLRLYLWLPRQRRPLGDIRRDPSPRLGAGCLLRLSSRK